MAQTDIHERYWIEQAKQLVGRTIRRVRYQTRSEAAAMGWHHRSLVIELDDGSVLFPSRDDEGNDAGALFVNTHTGQFDFPVLNAFWRFL